MEPYDHQTKAGNEGDVVKHPALTAALNGLLAEHDGLFRYCDAFAGRWEYELRNGGAWTSGIERFAAGWAGDNQDVALWRRQWTAAAGRSYPGSTQLAQRSLSDRGNYEIQAFEIVEAYASDLRQQIGQTAVLSRSATATDWSDWPPDLLFVDPPGLRSPRRPGYPTLESLLRLEHGIENVLMWLPLAGEAGSCGTTLPSAGTNPQTIYGCLQQGFQVLTVRWSKDEPTPGCLLVFRFPSPKVSRRVTAAVAEVARTMGLNWRMD